MVKLQLPPNSRFRHYKICLGEDRWYTIKRKIIHLYQLRQEICRAKRIFHHKGEVEVYFSTSEWLCPQRIEEPSFLADKCFLHNRYLVFDIDRSYKHKDKVIDDFIGAYNDCSELMRRMEKYSTRYSFRRRQFTGRGFRLLYKDKIRHSLPRNPILRMEYLMNKRLKFAHKFYDLKHLDRTITHDPRRIIRMEGFVNLKSGLRCIPLYSEHTTPESILKYAMTSLCKKTSFLTSETTILTSLQNSDIISGNIGGAGVTPPVLRYQFITNKVSKNLYIPFLIFYPNKYSPKTLELLSCLYKLSDWFVFETEEFILCWNLKCVDKIRLLKIMRNSKCQNLRMFLHFGKQWIRFSSVFQDKAKIKSAPIFKEVVKSPYFTGSLSLPHLRFLEEILHQRSLCSPKDLTSFCGKEIIKEYFVEKWVKI